MGVKDRYNEKQKTSNNKTEITTKSGTSTTLGVKQRYEQKKSSSNNTGSVSQIDLDNHKKYLEQQAAYEKRLSYDLDAGAKEIAYLESIQDEVTKLNVMTQHSNMIPADAKARIQSRYDELDAQLGEYGGLDALKSVISEKKQEYSLAERAQRAKELTSVMDEKSESYDVDFNKYATLGADYGKDPEKWWQSAENYVAYLRNNPEQLKAYDEVAAKNANAIVKNVSMDQLSYKAAKYMKDEEYSLYNYYFAKDKENGTKLADEYLRSIEDVLNSRQATGIVEDYSNKSDIGKILYAGEVGLDQFISGMEGWAADGYTAPSAIQQAGGAIREDLKDTGRTLPEWLGGASLGQAAYDVVSTTSNMLPSILASTVVNAVAPGAGTVVGATLMGASAGGNARAEMLNLGYSKEQATTYGILIGAAEAGMEYVLGNIHGLSKGDGIFSTLGTKVATKVDNAIARVAIKLGENGTKVLKAVAGGAIKMTGGALDEALEEGLQTVIEPWLKEIATSVDWDDPKIDEILYSSLLGALSSFALGGAQTTIESSISNGVSNANAEYVYGDGKDLVSEAIELDPSNAFAQKMQAKVNEGKSLSGRQINRLVQQNETAKLAFSETEGADFDVKVAADTNVGGKSAPAAEISAKAERATVNTAEENGAKTGEKLASVTATNAKGETVKGEIRKVEANGDKVSFVLANGEKVAREDASFASDDMQLVADIATEHISLLDGFTPEAATAMIKGYDGSTDAAQYVAAFDAAYKLGADGAPSSALVRLMNDGVSERVAYTAYVIGKDSVKNAQNALKNGENNGIINNTNENSEAEYESGESIRLRDGGKRSGGQNTDGQVSRMESSTGQAESEAESRRIADSEAARLLNEGREVKVASLGILGGSHEQTVRLVDPASETTSMKEARKQAEARGLKVKFFVGDNLLIKGKDGKWISARAYIKGGFVFVRGDHAKYTADQLMRHELGHDMIAKGEVDIDAVRERLVDLVGKENLDAVAKLYADAYAGTGMTADEIWEECICDSLGDMNIFADVNDLGEFMEGILPEIQKAASQNKAPTQTRGSPEGKASRDIIDNYTLTDEFLREVPYGMREAFARSLANKTSGMVEGEVKTIYVVGYIFEADGYMHGHILAPYNEKTKNLLEVKESGYDEIDENRRGASVWAEAVQDAERGSRSNSNVSRRGRSDTDDTLFGASPERNSSGNNERVRTTFETKEEAERILSQLRKLYGIEEEVSTESTSENGKASRELDTEYLSAVNRGDMESAQRMVDEAAKEAGYTIKAYHGTKADFTKFSKEKMGSNFGNWSLFGAGFYFAPTKTSADYWGSLSRDSADVKVMPVYLRTENMISANDAFVNDKSIDIVKKLAPAFDNEDIMWTLDRLSRFVEFLINKGYSANGVREVFLSMGYDGVDYSSLSAGKYRQYAVFDPEQIKSADPVTYDDNGNVIPLSERFNAENDDIRYSQELDFVDFAERLSTREVLANALESVAQDDLERTKLKDYKENIAHYDAEEAKLKQIRAEIKELSFATGERDTAKIRQLRDEALKTENRINIYDKLLLSLEASAPIKKVLDREKKKAYERAYSKAYDKAYEKGYGAAEKKADKKLESYSKRADKKLESVKSQYEERIEYYRSARKEAVERVTETHAKNDAKSKLQKLVLDTAKWISHPSKDDVKCPDIIKGPYASFLESIDLSSDRKLKGGEITANDIRVGNALNRLANAVEQIKNAQDPATDTDKVLVTGYLDLKPEFVAELRTMAENISDMMVDGDYVINQMSAHDITQLSKLIRSLNHSIKEMSTLYATMRFASVEELGQNTIKMLASMGEAEKTGGVKDFVFWDNALPYYAHKRFGEGGNALFEGFMDAQDKLAYHSKTILDYKAKNWTDKEAKTWSEDTHTIQLPSGGSLTLTTADAMGIYCLSRRDQGKQHLLGGGTRVIGLKKGNKKAKDSRSTLSQADLDKIIASLDNRQKKVAEAIQSFMVKVCAEWGNEISMKRFLTKDFNDPFYYPIESNDENLSAKDPGAQKSDLYRLLNISATKPLTPGANNEVIIRNIFEVFADHSSDMAKLNAFGLPLLDYMKWLNYREKYTNGEGQISVVGVRKAMNTAYGDKAWGYVMNLVKDINGRHTDNGDNPFLMKMMRLQKTANVGNDLRVTFLQFTSYPRAVMVLSPKSLALGLTKIPKIEKAKQYCGIALWKSFGFYDTNISRTIEEQIKGTTNIRQKLIEISMLGPEYADAITWGALWNACEYEVSRTTKNKIGSEAFNQEVGLKLREVVYATQVVDSILTRSQIMRSKSGLTQVATSYMSEPTLTANILMDAAFEFQKEKRITGSSKAAWQKTGKLVTLAVGSYLSLQLISSIAESLADAWRDDDEEEFKEKFKEAFGENLITNLIPFNKVPILADISELLLSFFGIGFVSSDNLATQWITQASTAVKTWSEVLGEARGDKNTSKTVYNAIYQSVKVLSSMTGVAVSGAMREVVAVWNNTAGAADSTLKITTYEPSKTELGNRLYNAIIEGDKKHEASLRAEFEDDKAIESAIRKALRENDPRIKEAAEARYKGDSAKYERLVREIVKEGHFSQDLVIGAVNTELNDLRSKETKTEEEEKTEKVTSLYSTYDLEVAFKTGKTDRAVVVIDELIKNKVANGMEEKAARSSVKSSVTSYWKPLYKAAAKAKNEAEKKRIREILKATGLYGNATDIVNTVNGWLKEKE